MKKIKLLAPIIGATATLGAVLPVVSCKTEAPEEDTDADINVLNISDNEPDVILSSDIKTTEINKDLELTISWPKGEQGVYYYPNLITIFAGENQIPLSDGKNPDGYTIKKYNSESVNIFIPGSRIKSSAKINILVDMEKGAYQEGSDLDTFKEDGLTYTYQDWWQTITYKFDVLTNNGGPNEDPTIENLLEISKNSGLAINCDLSKWNDTKNPLANDEHLYLIMGSWDEYDPAGTSFHPLDPKLECAGYVYYNGKALHTEEKIIESSSFHYIDITPPEGGWTVESQRSSLTCVYYFTAAQSRFQVLIGKDAVED